MVVKQRHNDKTYAYSGFPDSSVFGFTPGTPIYLPIHLRDYYGWYSHAWVQNTGNNFTWVLVEYYDELGDLDYSQNIGVDPGASQFVYYLYPPQDYETSAMKLTSDIGEPIVATAIQYDAPYIEQSDMTSSYIGFSVGSNDVYLPGLYKNYYGWTSAFRVQNLSSSPATLTIRYYASSGTSPGRHGPFGAVDKKSISIYACAMLTSR